MILTLIRWILLVRFVLDTYQMNSAILPHRNLFCVMLSPKLVLYDVEFLHQRERQARCGRQGRGSHPIGSRIEPRPVNRWRTASRRCSCPQCRSEESPRLRDSRQCKCPRVPLSGSGKHQLQACPKIRKCRCYRPNPARYCSPCEWPLSRLLRRRHLQDGGHHSLSGYGC